MVEYRCAMPGGAKERLTPPGAAAAAGRAAGERVMWILLTVLLALLLLAAAAAFLIWPRRGQWQLQELRRFRYAHRGLFNPERGVPENSIKAFRYAVAGGFGIELDVRLTGDKRLAVVHDSNLMRLCGRSVRVEETPWEELQELRLMETEERIPLLEEVLRAVRGRVPLIIEIKTERNNSRELCAKVCRLLERYKGNFCVESFDPRALRWLRRNEPFVIRGQLVTGKTEPGRYRKSDPMRFLSRLLPLLLTNVIARPDFIACQLEDRKRPAVRLCVEGLKAQEVSWTIRSQEELEEAERTGAMVIFEGFLPKGPLPAGKTERSEKQ